MTKSWWVQTREINYLWINFLRVFLTPKCCRIELAQFTHEINRCERNLKTIIFRIRGNYKHGWMVEYTHMPSGIPRLLPINSMKIRHFQKSSTVWLNRWVRVSVYSWNFLFSSHQILWLELTLTVAFITQLCCKDRTFCPCNIKIQQNEFLTHVSFPLHSTLMDKITQGENF